MRKLIAVFFFTLSFQTDHNFVLIHFNILHEIKIHTRSQLLPFSEDYLSCLLKLLTNSITEYKSI